MTKKAIETLRNGLEDSHWYSDDDEKIFNELVIKAKAFDRIVEERNRIGKLMHNKEYPQIFTDEVFWNIDDIIDESISEELKQEIKENVPEEGDGE